MSKMKLLKFELDRAGVRELLKSEKSEDMVKEIADKAQGVLGDGYEVSTYRGKNRVNASIYAETYQARQENAKTNSILKAIGGAGN